jgi:hypothetical protein
VAVEFEDTISVPALPLDVGEVGRLSARLRERGIAAGGHDQLIKELIDAIFAVSPADSPSELGRLRLHYQRAYSRGELEALAATTLSGLGVRIGAP